MALSKQHKALAEAWFALELLEQQTYLAAIEELTHDVKAVEQARAARDAVFAAMTPQMQLALLPSYTKVAIRNDHTREGEEIVGQVRDCLALRPQDVLAVDPMSSGSRRLERRITSVSGFEVFSDEDNPITAIRILSDEEWEQLR